jgi:gliding motility-associated-like protein
MKKIKRTILLFLFFVASTTISVAQIDTAFWFAAPWSTPDHTERQNIVVHISTFSAPSTTVYLRQPAAIAPNRYDTIMVIGPNQTFDYVFWRDKVAAGPPSTITPNVGFDSLETKPANTVVPYGIYISSSSDITVVYDVICQPPGFNNPETFSLKGQNGFGKEFVCPQQTLYRNRSLGDRNNTPAGVLQPKQQIVIVATQANTVVWITPRCNVVGHIANVTYSVLLPSAGSCYNIENLVQNTYLPGNSLSGTIVVSDKPIAVTVADDSINNTHSSTAEPGLSTWGGMGCYDLVGDQIVPVDVVGKDYIINRGQLFRENQLGAGHPGMKESAFIVATENFTQLTINAGGTPTFTYLNKGDTYVDTLTTDLTYVHADKNVYVYHLSGIGCELGAAILPPLSCAGSKLVAFSRNTPQQFALNILCKNGSQNTFTLNGSTTLVPPSSFTIVPGTATLQGGPYYGAQISLSSIVTLPIGSYTIGNTADEFALGVFDGGSTSGGLFHYMSAFLRKTVVETQTLNPICAGSAGTVAVTGTITGADITGYWSTSYSNGSVTVNGGASGSFPLITAYSSSINVISTIYTVSSSDTTSALPTKTITLYLNSLGSCKSVTDSVKLVINQRPQVSVSSGTIMCKNNVVPVILSGTVTNAVSGLWTGGNGGIFGAPGLVTTYTPSQADLVANTITLNLTSQAPLSGCPNTIKTLTVGFINPPLVTIVPNNAVVCTNSSTLELNGNVSGTSTTGIWQGGTGAFTLTNTSPTATYILSPSDLTQSSITLTLSSTNNGICASESATMFVTVIAKPVITTPPNFTVCAGSVSALLSGTVSGSSTQGIWTSSTAHGAFSNQQPQTSPVNTTYSLSSLDTNFIYFRLESAPGICPTERDSVKASILAAPEVRVNNAFIPVCKNSPIALTGTVTGYTNSGIWSTSSNTSSPGTFTPGANFLYGTYLPSEADIANGFVILTLTSTNNQQCPPSSSAFTASFIPSPNARFTFSPKRCVNSPLIFSDASQSNGTAFLKWSWDFGDNSPTGGSSSPNPIKTYTVASQYLVTLTVTGVSLLNVECPDVFDTLITIKPLPIANFKVAPACQDYPVKFTNQSIAPPGSDPIVAWKWEFGDSALFNVPPLFTGIPTSTVSHVYAKAERFSTFLTVTATPVGVSPSLGCVSDPHREYVDVFSKPKAEFGLTNNPSVVQEPVYFSDFTTPTGNIASWYWEFGDEGASTEQAPVHTFQQAGIFSIKLTVTDFAGCRDTLRKEIDVTLLPQLPGAFSPNGDGVNDLLYVKGGPFAKMIFRVYNNWGEIVFETADQNIGWDGKKNGVEQPVGVYIWTLVADMYNNRQVRKNGDITLLR